MEEIASLFHENTKTFEYQNEIMIKHTAKLLENRHAVKKMSNPYKEYKNVPKILLSKSFSNSGRTIEEVIIQRKSDREFSDIPLSKDKISKILFYSYGLNGRRGRTAYDDVIMNFRNSPSGGGLYPLEIYLAVFNVEDLKKGIYHYNVKKHTLEYLFKGDYKMQIYRTSKQEMILKCSAAIILTAIFNRTMMKYKERGYRYILFEAGHVMQNAYLISIAMDLGICSVGGFIDDKINDLLNIDGVNESALYLGALGKIES